MEQGLPSIPVKRYFTIGEVAELCGVKPHVLRYWEQEFTQLRPMKRRGNRRYYQHHEVLMIRRIRDLLYDQGFTISGARNKLQEMVHADRERRRGSDGVAGAGDDESAVQHHDLAPPTSDVAATAPVNGFASSPAWAGRGEIVHLQQLRRELREIRELLSPASY
ncbi:MerR family transcriptional regulator [Xenophilus sp.]|uniref:MerR family transcriptional regulator n=1 Tax=Xenophilus sp. TaxID=1873499 RepID=UPI0037DC88C0